MAETALPPGGRYEQDLRHAGGLDPRWRQEPPEELFDAHFKPRSADTVSEAAKTMRTTIVVALLLALSLAVSSQEPKPAAKSKWVEPTREEPPGTKYKTFQSKTIDGPVSYLIYLPPDYDRETTKRYPVLYFIPGGAGNQRGGGGIVGVLDAAIRKGDVPPLIVVLAHQPPQGMWSDSSDGKQPVETVIIKDLIPHVDQTYRTIAERRARWIEGFSMGGRGAALLGFKNPELFGGVSILAGALMDFEFFTKFNNGEMFKSVYGEKRDNFDKHDPYKLAEKNIDAIRGKTLVRIMVGDKDTMGSQYVTGYTCFKANQEFHEHLDRLKIPHDYIELPGVGHGYLAQFSKGGDRALGFYKKAFEKMNEKPPAIPAPPPAKPNDKPLAAEISGKLKSVDVEKNTITVTVGDKDQVFEIPGAAKLIGPGGNELPDRLKTPKTRLDDKIAVAVTVKTEKKDGKEVVTEVRFRRAGTTDGKPPPPGAKPENPPSRPVPEIPQSSEEKVTFATHIAPFLAKYCTTCHGGAKPKGDLALDAFKDEGSVMQERETWQQAIQNLRSGRMPPRQAQVRPTPNEIAVVSRWLDSLLGTADTGKKDPGRVTIRRFTRLEYRNTIRELLGVDFDVSSFPGDESHQGFNTNADSVSLPPLLMEKYVDAAEKIAALVFKTPAARKRLMTSEPLDKTKKESARQILETLVSRAYRRPATPSEVDRLLRLVNGELEKQAEDSFDKAIQLALQAVLISPHFLLRIELDPEPDNPSAVRPVNDYELASRLSYFLWSSMPDEELFEHAGKGTLRQNLEAQVRRMLRDPKAHALAESFGGQWLETRRLKVVTPDKDLFPRFDEDLRDAMFQETALFFAAIISEDRSVLDFVDGQFTFVNERLARHYGIPDIKGPSFRRVTLSGEQRGGVLTHASVLTVTSNPDRTSPVKRGKWILDNLLGAPPSPAPGNVPELAQDKEPARAVSLRKLMEQHRSNPNCASCHQLMDPLGFGLENYDAIGAWRDQDGKFPIDASATLPDGKAFNGVGELKSVLKTKADDFTRCLAEKMLSYALGRGLERYDQSTVDEICRTIARKEHRFSSLALGIVSSDPFQLRRGETRDTAVRISMPPPKPGAKPPGKPAKPADRPLAAEISGKLKSVDLEKSAITVTVGDQDQVFEIPGAAKLLGREGGEIRGGLKAVKANLERVAVTVTIQAEKKDGKEVVTEVRFRAAGTKESKPQPPGAKPEKPPSRPDPGIPQFSEEKVKE